MKTTVRAVDDSPQAAEVKRPGVSLKHPAFLEGLEASLPTQNTPPAHRTLHAHAFIVPTSPRPSFLPTPRS